LLDEPFGALDARVRAELREWLRRLHDEVHVTTVFVTHDQEEALELADRIVVMNSGRVEQIAPPRELYDHPENAFVMSFVGPVNRLGDAWVRPHDVELRLDPNGSTQEAQIERIVRLGFETRVELEIADRIVVMNSGRVEQIAPPRELYDHPENAFVMSFVGPVNRLGDAWVRPHDVELRLDPNGSTQEAQIERIVRLGFETRVEL